MTSKIVSPPPKKSENSKQMMGLIENKGQAKQDPEKQESVNKMKVLLDKNKIDPKIVIQLGDMAKKAIRDKSLYPIVKENVLKYKLADKEQVKDGYNINFLSSVMAAGEMAKMITGGK